MGRREVDGIGWSGIGGLGDWGGEEEKGGFVACRDLSEWRGSGGFREVWDGEGELDLLYYFPVQVVFC